jgi:unsaturated rhamnogalacturonyl hydrolase
VVRACRMRAGHGGVTIGSEVSGSVRDVFVERSEMTSPDLERGIRFKTNAVRGGTIENVFVRDVEIGEAGSAIDVDMLYEEGAAGAFTPVVRNVVVDRMRVRKATYAFFMRGLAGSPVRGVTVRDSTFQGVARGSLLQHVEDLTLLNVVLVPEGGKAKEQP